MHDHRNDKKVSSRTIFLFVFLVFLVAYWLIVLQRQNVGLGNKLVEIPVVSAFINNEIYPKRKTWKPAQGTHLNVSHFIYRDVNRNGIYDLVDRPMVDIAVRLTRQDGSQVTRRSNIHGFVNFTNSLTAMPVDVSVPGEYKLEVLVPDGWLLTSNNAIQTVHYQVMPESRPGLIADKVPVPAGLAQRLTISGRASSFDASENNQIEITARSTEGVQQQTFADRKGQFSFDVDAGEWMITATAKNPERRVTRKVLVDQAPVRLATIFIDKNLTPQATNSYLVDFELITQSVITKMPSDPSGIKWENLIVTNNEFYRGEGYINNTISGHYVAYNTSGYPVTISHENGFNFYGGYFGVAWRIAESETLQVRAWRGSELVGSEDYELSALGPFWFAADYQNITRLELSTKHYWQFVTDDLSLGLDL